MWRGPSKNMILNWIYSIYSVYRDRHMAKLKTLKKHNYLSLISKSNVSLFYLVAKALSHKNWESHLKEF
jgi:hypothetical protein